MTFHLLYLQIFFLFVNKLKSSSAQSVPALFVFGDSLVDVGNNNYLTFSIFKGDHPNHGVDFPTHKPNGRFSNGKIAADFLAEKLGLQSPLPYLYLMRTKTNEFSTGVSFASAAAGILNSTNRCLDLPLINGLDDEIYHFMIPMDEQVEYYIKTRGILVENFGELGAAKLLSESVFTIVMGNTDIGTYFYSRCASIREKRSPQQYIDIIVITMKRHLKRIYDHGGRKFVIFGVGPIGCTPSARVNTKNEACDEVSNYWASKYNQALLLVLRDLMSEFQDFIYSYINIYDLFLNIVEQADSYGFKDKKTACCGLGRLNADEGCYPISSLCPNRSDHIFWDLYHPTEAFTRIIVEAVFDGPQHYAFPVNVRQLVST